ncbi:MAG: ABC transporter ATP-binding protein [Nitrospirae bacterium GWD2_57_9]|nr:MAG: ABC transporter ATP-binding protein [Nitrospirae bacterium GWD2_57_9]
MHAVIEVQEIVKTYPGVRAVDRVSLGIRPGVCFGLLGPNGAGKTTLIEIVEGIQQPDSGVVLYEGEPAGSKFRREAGIQFQVTSLQEFLTVRETLRLFKNLYPRTLAVNEVVRLCSLDDFLDRDTRKLSGGQRQRLLMALAIINDPIVLFLDEPTTGLDPQSRRNFWDLINLIKSRNRTVVLTTHYMDEAYALCDEIAIMDHGKIIAQGTPERLLKEHFGDVVLQFPDEEIGGKLAGLGLCVSTRPGWCEIQTRDVDGTLRTLLDRGVSLNRMSIRSWSLEDLFLALTGKDLRS